MTLGEWERAKETESFGDTKKTKTKVSEFGIETGEEKAEATGIDCILNA